MRIAEYPLKTRRIIEIVRIVALNSCGKLVTIEKKKIPGEFLNNRRLQPVVKKTV